MNHSIVFSFIAIGSIFLLTLVPAFQSTALFLILFFILGLPHGAFDVVLGKEMLYRPFGKKWWIPFSFIYLLLSLIVIAFWTLWPFLSFVFFLLISILHFGFGDAVEAGYLRPFEGIARGLIPVAAPAYFYPAPFQMILQSTLSYHEAAQITFVLSALFIPAIILIGFFILFFLVRKNGSLAIELMSFSAIFIVLPPFQAFIIYFCFLHSIRHTLHLMNETQKSFNSIVYAALIPTFLSAIFLLGLYLILRKNTVDFDTMYYLFFMGIAALTFPHMLLVEWLYSASNKSAFKMNR